MARRMSCALTIDAVRARTKTVTRRHPDRWSSLAVGDELVLIEKGMGLARGERQVVLARVRVLSNEVIPLLRLNRSELRAEGFDPDEWGIVQWCRWWADGHGFGKFPDVRLLDCRRIEWEYLPDPANNRLHL